MLKKNHLSSSVSGPRAGIPNATFAGYDFRVSAPIELVIDLAKAQFNLEITASEIDELCESKLLEFAKKKSGRVFPLFTPGRVAFIKKVQAKFNYPITILQQIITYENYLIRHIVTAEEFAYPPKSLKKGKYVLDWFVSRLRHELQQDKHSLRISKKMCSQNDKLAIERVEGLRKEIKVINKNIRYLSNKKWKDLPEATKQAIKARVFSVQATDELTRQTLIGAYNNQILQGYSPQVEFMKHMLGETSLDFSEIDWQRTVRSTKDLEYIEFFRTPYFIIELQEGVIIFKILDPARVEANLMRRINKLYTIFRQRLDTPRKPWGVNSGRRINISQRDENMKKMYRKMRKEKPNVGANIHIASVVEWTKEIGLPVSEATARRIIYPIKDK